MFNRLIAISILFVFSSNNSFSQDDTTETRKNVFTAGVNYQSRLHYFGRTDELKSNGLFPSIGYELKQGFYGNANIIFINNAANSISYTGAVIEGGFKFPEKNKWSGNIFYSHFLYNSNSVLVQSALNSQAGINGVYSNDIINLNAGADVKFSDRTDFGITAGVDRLFIYSIPDTKNAVAVNPSFYVYAGSQNFTETYSENSGRSRRGGIGTSTKKQVTGFNILAYEFSAPIVFVTGKFNASLTPSYILPQNLYTVPNRPDISETGGNMLYWSAGIGVRL